MAAKKRANHPGPGWPMRWVEVTPQIAKEYLAKSRGNRKEAKGYLASFETQMRNNEWEVTPHSIIVFDEDGVLRDAHHRLHSIVESGTTQLFLVMWNVPGAACDLMDLGKPRSVVDVFEIGQKLGKAGYADVTDVRARKQVLRALEVMVDGGYIERESPAKLRRLMVRFPCVDNFARTMGTLSVRVPQPGKKKKLMSAPLAAALMWTHEVYPIKVADLLDALAVEDYMSCPHARLIRDLECAGAFNTTLKRREATMKALGVLWAWVTDKELRQQPPAGSEKGYEAIKAARIEVGLDAPDEDADEDALDAAAE